MNLLMVSPFFPAGASSGACTRCYYLLKALAREYTVSLVVLTDAVHEAKDTLLEELKLRQFVNVPLAPSFQHKRVRQVLCMLSGRSPLLDVYRIEGVQRALDTLLDLEHYDVVLFESALMAADYKLPRHTRVIIDEHDIEYEILYRTYLREKSFFRKWYNWWESRQVRLVEIRRCANADGVFVTSERELFLLKSFLPQSMIVVVPNGVDIKAFQPADQKHEIPGRIIFTGSMEHYPNIDAVINFAWDCWPLIRSKAPDATWQIVGRNPPPSVLDLAKLPGISVTGTVANVRPYLAAATLAIAPLFIGSGTRLKILEAFAMGKAVVSTSLGCEGLKVVSGKHLIVADQSETFAQSVVNLLQNAKQRTALGRAGRALAKTYSWDRCADAAIRAVEEIAKTSSHGHIRPLGG